MFPVDLLALPASLFLLGLASGGGHCALMCGPFVLARVAQAGARLPAEAMQGMGRLRLGALPFYHLGRATTYAAFGAVAGGVGGGFAALLEADWLRAALLGLTALLFVGHAVGAPGLAVPERFGVIGHRLADFGRRLTPPGSVQGDYVLGVTLGFLPCGLIYGALAGAAGAGTAGLGALAMAAFAAGTAIPLAALGVAGAAAVRRWQGALKRFALPLAAVSLLALAYWTLGGHGHH